MNGAAMYAIFVQSFKETIRSKWLIMFAVVFFFLAFNLPLATLAAFNFLPQGYLSQFISTIITVTFPLIPLLPLPLGATSIVEERESGFLQYVLTTPIARTQYLAARIIGLYIATTTIIVIGFGVAAIIAFRPSLSVLSVGYVVVASLVLNAAMLGIGMLVSVLSRRRATALGASIFIWFVFTTISDSNVLAPIFTMAHQIILLIPFILLNPVESARLVVLAHGSYSVVDLGASGMAMGSVFGSSFPIVLAITMSLWVVITFAATFLIFMNQDIR
ncbi:MAG TPA: ABC transporter permease [Nitrososphaerales archaeon]|nr:ABC transporter permease [Nitrososphaerales archaeon]